MILSQKVSYFFFFRNGTTLVKKPRSYTKFKTLYCVLVNWFCVIVLYTSDLMYYEKYIQI